MGLQVLGLLLQEQGAVCQVGRQMLLLLVWPSEQTPVAAVAEVSSHAQVCLESR